MLALGAVMLPSTRRITRPAMVEASRTWRLIDDGPGRYRSVLYSGQPAHGLALVHERVYQFAKNDLVELALSPDLVAGESVHAGDVLGRLHSPRNARLLEELQAERAALQAEQARLAAGSKAQKVALARREVALAQAVLKGDEIEVARAHKLSEEGAISDAELQAVELRQQVHKLGMQLAQDALAVARSPARSESIDAVAARIDAIDARIAEVRDALSGQTVISPIDGVVEFGGPGALISVYDLNQVYLRIPIPEDSRLRVAKGAQVSFAATGVPDRRFQATVVDISDDATPLAGTPVFWASALVENHHGLLRSGMSGTVRVMLGAPRAGMLASLWHELVGA